jgi:hypothetical protein
MNTHEPFAAFCNRVGSGTIKLPEGNHTLPEEYEKTTMKVLQILREKKSSFANYPIAYIQSRFNDMNEVEETLKEKTVNGEIPDGILAYLAYHLYTKFNPDGTVDPGNGVAYNNLPKQSQNIIKIAACYIILQS